MPHARKISVRLADRLAFSLAEVSGLTGFSLSYLYELIRRGLFRTERVEGRRIATASAVAELLGVANLAEVLGTSAETSREQPPALVIDAAVREVPTARRFASRALARRRARPVARGTKQEEGPS
jgi:hypothetical protein